MSDNSGSEIVGTLVVIVLALYLLAHAISLAIASLPFAIFLYYLLKERSPIPCFSFGLAIGLIFYVFTFGLDDSFPGLIFRLLSYEFPSVSFEEQRFYCWLTYPSGIALSLALRYYKVSAKRNQRNKFDIVENSDGSGFFFFLLNILSYICLPFFAVLNATAVYAAELRTSQQRKKVFLASIMLLFYTLIYLTFGPLISHEPEFGFILNKTLLAFDFVPLWPMDIAKHYFYFVAAVFPLVWWTIEKVLSEENNMSPEETEPDEGEGSSHNIYGPEGVYLGIDHQRDPVFLSNETLNHHVHVVGASGFGKTNFLTNIIREKVACGEGVIFVDLKGDIGTVCDVASFALDTGRLDEFEFFSISESYLDVSCGISFFENGNALEIKDKIMGAFRYEHDYYKKRAESFLVLALRALVYLRDQKGEKFDFNDIYKLTQGFENIEELSFKIDNPEIREDLRALIQDRKLKDDLAGLKADIESLIKTDFGHLLSCKKRKGVNLYDSIRSGKIVYIHLDSQRYEASAEKLGRLILQEIKTASARIVTSVSEEDRNPYTLIVDEFANLATEQFVGFLNRARASGIGIVVAHQELSDLDVFSPTVKDQIMTNTSTLFSFLQKLPASAEMIAGVAGTETTQKETMQYEEGVILKNQKKTGLGTLREAEEYIIHPNLIKELRRGECFMISKYPSTKISKVFVDFCPIERISHNEFIELMGKKNEPEEMPLLEGRIPLGDKEDIREEDWL